MGLAAASLDVNLEHIERDCGASSLWPAGEEKVGVPPSSATRGNITDAIQTPPWAQVVDGSSWKDLGARGRVRSGGKQRIGWRFSRGSFWGLARIEVWQDFFHASESMLSSTVPLTSSYVAVYFLVSDSRCCRLPSGEFPASCAFPSSVV
ncbi:hypothetical protein Taro_029184 [Colocasia esculenta]|uniref:Uncharacterized protein n=1 Tax=Colocasia esculenta TaxID=4460 RepID=A0A843VQD8_COLES|nr:hypothetical protein [Colocasia esculenta]